MRIAVWTLTVKKDMVPTEELKENGRPKHKRVYTLNKKFYRKIVTGPNYRKKTIEQAWKFAEAEVNRLLAKGLNIMGVAIAWKGNKYAYAVCSAYEDNFSLARSSRTATKRFERGTTKTF
jgi:hypothetical protein